jgi:hypothetical protein
MRPGRRLVTVIGASAVLIAGIVLPALAMPSGERADGRPSPDVATTDIGAIVTGDLTMKIQQRRAGAGRERYSDFPGRRRESGPREVRNAADVRCSPLGVAAGISIPGQCSDLITGIPTEPVQTRPSIDRITAAVVLSEVRRLNFPGSVVHVEPRGKTLVNLATNVYATPRKIDRTITVLRWPVRILATPTYTWKFGDGTSITTTTAGAPHPHAEVTHKYLARGKVVVSVTLNYDTWYQVPGGDLLNAGVVNITGPGTPVEVCEARPVLTDPDNDAPPTPTPTAGTGCR